MACAARWHAMDCAESKTGGRRRRRSYEARQRRRRPCSPARRREPRRRRRPEPAAAEGPMKETTKGLRWVAITGVLDYKKLRDNYLNALKMPSRLPALQAARRRAPGRAARRLLVRVGADRSRIGTDDPRQPARGRGGIATPETSGSTRWSTLCPSSRRATGSGSTSPAWSPRRRSRSPSRPAGARRAACDPAEMSAADGSATPRRCMPGRGCRPMGMGGGCMAG